MLKLTVERRLSVNNRINKTPTVNFEAFQEHVNKHFRLKKLLALKKTPDTGKRSLQHTENILHF